MAELPTGQCRNIECLCVNTIERVMSKVAFKGIPYSYMAMLLVLSPSPYAILCIKQVSTMANVVM